MFNSKRSKIYLGFSIFFFLLLILSFVLAFVIFPDIIIHEVNKAVELEEGTEQYDRFVKLPFPFDFKVTFFNVENPKEILDGSAKPLVREIGPFVYREYRNKTIIRTKDEDDTIIYNETQTLEYNLEASGGLPEDTEITILNPLLMSVYAKIEPYFLTGIVDNCIANHELFGQYQKIFVTASVRDFLFDGIPMCGKPLPMDLCGLVDIIVCTLLLEHKNVDSVDDPPNGLIFSFFHYKNQKTDGTYAVNRGRKEPSRLGHITSWNQRTHTDFWDTDSSCSEIKGCDSTLYPPRISRDDTLSIFSTDICRTIDIQYQKELITEDIKVYKFGTNPKTLYAADTPENDCFCSNKTRGIDGKWNCFLDGTIDIYTCLNIPIILSFPHFLWAEHYNEHVDGLTPNEDLHSTFILLEPNTGIPLQGSKKVQLNSIMRPYVGLKSTRKASRALIPLVWVEESVVLPEKYVNELKSMYMDKVKIVDGVKWALIAASGGFFLIFTGLLIYSENRK